MFKALSNNSDRRSNQGYGYCKPEHKLMPRSSTAAHVVQTKHTTALNVKTNNHGTMMEQPSRIKWKVTPKAITCGMITATGTGHN